MYFFLTKVAFENIYHSVIFARSRKLSLENVDIKCANSRYMFEEKAKANQLSPGLSGYVFK